MAQRMPTKRTRNTPRAEEESLLRRLTDSLSEDEIRRVLACSLLMLDDAARDRLVERLGPETGTTLLAVLQRTRGSVRGAEPSGPEVSKGKLRQEWERLWIEWVAVVAETGHEQGRYVRQDAHWEPPYLDTSAIAEELNAIGARMRPLLAPVIREGVAPDFSFMDAVKGLEHNLGAGLPDWMESGEPFHLGREVTSCLLEWEWAIAQQNQLGAPAFIDGIREFESQLRRVTLDPKTLEEFILALSDEHLRAILESMVRQRSSTRWADAFSQAYGAWPEILRELSRRWAPALHDELCRANVKHAWFLALPLIQGALKRKASAEAFSLIDEAIRSMLRLEETEHWDPREQLLLHTGHFITNPRGTDVASLLRLWRRAARAAGQADLDAALTIQLTALREEEDGDVMLETFRATPPQSQKVRDALFADWRAFITEQTLQMWQDSPQAPCRGWVPALVNAAMEGPRRASEFRDAVRAVLKEASTALANRRAATGRSVWTTPDENGSPLRSLAILTLDLAATAPAMKKTAPRLFKLFSSMAEVERRGVAATRRKWCARLGGPSLLPDVLAFWRDNGIRFVPDPGSTTADYAQHVDWLAAVQELNPRAAAELLAQWAKAYPLKRNLWRELALRGFSVPPGVRTAPLPRER